MNTSTCILITAVLAVCLVEFARGAPVPSEVEKKENHLDKVGDEVLHVLDGAQRKEIEAEEEDGKMKVEEELPEFQKAELPKNDCPTCIPEVHYKYKE